MKLKNETGIDILIRKKAKEIINPESRLKNTLPTNKPHVSRGVSFLDTGCWLVKKNIFPIRIEIAVKQLI